MNKKYRTKNKPKIKNPVEIISIAPLGWAVAGKGRERVHVWGGLLGDQLLIGGFKHERGRVEATIEEVIERTVVTVDPPCEHFDVCGGCLWQHVPYAEQLLMKREIVKSCFASARLDTASVLPVLGCETPYAYRNKNDFTFGFGPEPALGFFESEIKKTHGKHRPVRRQIPDVFDVRTCVLQSDIANHILERVGKLISSLELSYFHPGSRRGIMRSLIIRQSAQSGDVLVHFVAAKDCADDLKPLAKILIEEEPCIKGVVLSINNKRSKNAVPQAQRILAGDGWIVEQILGLSIRVSPTSFLQINTKQAEKLYEVALDFANLDETKKVVDLYCGTGSLSLLLAQRAQQVLGIEVIAAAVKDAQANALENQVENCQFVCGDVAQVLPTYVQENTPDVVTVNPPRAGVHQSVIQAICSVLPKEIVYISCNAETLARDLVHLIRGGYRIETVQPVDMFPQTPHVEVVVKLVQR